MSANCGNGCFQLSHVHVDETPWPVLGVKEWLWVTADDEFCESLRERVLSPATLVLFHAGDTRKACGVGAISVRTAFNGVISTDDGARLQRLPSKGPTEM